MKSMLNMLKLGLILAAYSLVACVGLAFVYAGTKTVIAQRAAADRDAAIQELFPAADGFKAIDPSPFVSGDKEITITEAFAVSAAGAPSGVALKVVGPSYAGATTILVGVGADRKVAGVKILENKDTAGLGANAASPSYFVDKKTKTTFYGQFAGKSIDDPFKAKGDIIAITASTITSASIAKIVKVSGIAAGEWLAGQGAAQ